MNPIADSLKDLIDRDAESLGSAPRPPGMRDRILRRRIIRRATQMTMAAALVGIVAVSGLAVARALTDDEAREYPVAPPVPSGYERIIVPLNDQPILFEASDSFDSLAQLLAGESPFPCGEPVEIANDPTSPFRLSFSSIVLEPSPDPADSAIAYIEAAFTYDGTRHGLVDVTGVLPVLLDDGVSASISNDEDFGAFSLLAEEFLVAPDGPPADYSGPLYSASTLMVFPFYGCESSDSPAWDDAPPLLGPGTYDLVLVTQVTTTPLGILLDNADGLDLDPSWFGSEWTTEAPCTTALEKAGKEQNGNVIECRPNLYYQRVYHANLGVSAFAIVDVPTEFLSAGEETWIVVSEPHTLIVG